MDLNDLPPFDEQGMPSTDNSVVAHRIRRRPTHDPRITSAGTLCLLLTAASLGLGVANLVPAWNYDLPLITAAATLVSLVLLNHFLTAVWIQRQASSHGYLLSVERYVARSYAVVGTTMACVLPLLVDEELTLSLFLPMSIGSGLLALTLVLTLPLFRKGRLQ